MEEIEVKKRIRIALEVYKENPTSLSKRFGVNQKTLNNQINSDTSLSLSTILLLLGALPNISLDWLISGVGEMQRTSAGVAITGSGNTTNGNDSAVVNRFLSIIEEKDRQIAQLISKL